MLENFVNQRNGKYMFMTKIIEKRQTESVLNGSYKFNEMKIGKSDL